MDVNGYMRYGGSITSLLAQRELYGGQVYKRPFIKDFSCEGPFSGSIICDASTQRSSPVFGLKYSSGVYTKLLAASDEDGFLSIINTNNKLPTTLSDDASIHRPVAQWLAHSNAIFDLSWAKDDSWMYTCSGDTSIRLFDTAYATKISTFGGHAGSVKSISVSPNSHSIFASGGRDGMIHLWDARIPKASLTTGQKYHFNAAMNCSSITHCPVLSLRDAHAPVTSQRKRQKTLQGRPPPSVTALQFLSASSGHVLCSGGIDGVVKFWDVRYTLEPTNVIPPSPLSDAATTLGTNLALANNNARMELIADANQAELGDRQYAVTSLALHPDGSRLLVSFIRGHHLLFDVTRPDAGPVQWFGGHVSSSFYVKSTFSPDGSHIASGSSDHGVYIWQAEGNNHGDDEAEINCATPYVLQGHDSEVTTVAWCPQDFCQLASAGDDHVVRVWNVHRLQEEETKDARKQWNERRMDVLGSLLCNGRRGSVVGGGDNGDGYSDRENDAAFAAQIMNNTARNNDDGDDTRDAVVAVSPYTPMIERTNTTNSGNTATTPAVVRGQEGQRELLQSQSQLRDSQQQPVTIPHAVTLNTQQPSSSRMRTTTTVQRSVHRMKISNTLLLRGQQAQHKVKRQQTLAEVLFVSRGRGNSNDGSGGGGGGDSGGSKNDVHATSTSSGKDGDGDSNSNTGLQTTKKAVL